MQRTPAFLLRACMILCFRPLSSRVVPRAMYQMPTFQIHRMPSATMTMNVQTKTDDTIVPDPKGAAQGDEFAKQIQPFWERRATMIGQGPLEEAKAMLLDDDAERYYEEEALIMIKALKGSMALAKGGEARCDEDKIAHTAVELGSGCGRITTRLAPLVTTLHAVELVKDFAKRCEANCLSLNLHNVVVHNTDACAFEWPEKLDLVLMKCVLMYVTDEQAVKLLERACEYLKPGGVLMLHECCSRTDYLNWIEPALDDYVAYYRPLSWYLGKLDDIGKGAVIRESYELDETVFVEYYKLYPEDPNCQPILTWVKS
jgi:SAM-dependent methyltransferase